MYNRNAPSIPSKALKWKPTGPEEDPTARLLAHIVVSGLDMHLEAYAVTEKNGEQRTVVWDDDVSKIYSGFCMEGPWRTLEINGREYILLAQPFG